MRVDAGVSRRAGEILVLSVRNVHECARVAILLRQTKVDNVHLVATFAKTLINRCKVNLSDVKAIRRLLPSKSYRVSHRDV